MQLATEKEVLSLYSIDKINQQKNALLYWKAIKLKEEKGLSAREISRIIDMSESAIYYWLQGFEPKSVKGINELKKMDLLPLKISKKESFKHLIHTFGLRYADGCVYHQKRNNSFTFYLCFGNKNDALTYIKDTKRIWNIDLKLHYSSRAYYLYLPSSLARLIIYLGSPIGRKTSQLFRIPNWIYKLPKNLKWEFLSGIFSGDGSTPKLKPSKNSSESLKLSLNAEKSIVLKFCNGFMSDIYNLLSKLNVKASKPKIAWNLPRISKEKVITYSVVLRVLTRKENMVKFLKNVNYKYSNKAYSKAKEVLNALQN